MNQALNGPLALDNATQLTVWYTGTDALLQGEGVCYKSTSDNYVERPSATNNKRFAGVVKFNTPGNTGGTTGQFVVIDAPSSQVKVAIGVDVAVGDIITCSAGAGDAGRFTLQGLPGRGSARVLEAVTAIQASLLDGTGSLATDGVTLTGSGFTGNVAANDTVVFVGSEDEGTSKTITLGSYNVASVTSDTVLVLSATAVAATPGAALLNSYYVIRNNPKATVELLDGPQSGLQEIVTPPNVGHASAATFTIMSGGVTYINGGITIGTANARAVLADGDSLGQVKSFKCLGTMTTNDAEIELATAGKQQAVDYASTGLPLVIAAITFDAADEIATLVWYDVWQEVTHVGSTIAAT